MKKEERLNEMLNEVELKDQVEVLKASNNEDDEDSQGQCQEKSNVR